MRGLHSALQARSSGLNPPPVVTSRFTGGCAKVAIATLAFPECEERNSMVAQELRKLGMFPGAFRHSTGVSRLP